LNKKEGNKKEYYKVMTIMSSLQFSFLKFAGDPFDCVDMNEIPRNSIIVQVIVAKSTGIIVSS
jgi:hypothetical protein